MNFCMIPRSTIYDVISSQVLLSRTNETLGEILKIWEINSHDLVLGKTVGEGTHTHTYTHTNSDIHTRTHTYIHTYICTYTYLYPIHRV